MDYAIERIDEGNRQVYIMTRREDYALRSYVTLYVSLWFWLVIISRGVQQHGREVPTAGCEVDEGD